LSTALPPVGVGVYGEDLTLNVESDATLSDQASWRLHHGTVDEARLPQISVNLAHPAFASDPALKLAVLDLRLGDRLVMEDPPAWLPSDEISQLVFGMTESITHFEHRFSLNCVPESPWRVGVLDDALLGRIDTDGSAVYEDAAAGNEIVYVTPTGDGGLWTTDPDDFPFDVRAGGEVLQVSAIGSDITSNPFFETDATGWAANNGSIAHSTAAVHPAASGSLRITPNGSSATGGADSGVSSVGTAASGDEVVVSMWVYSPAGWPDIRPCVDWYDSAGALVSEGLGSSFVVPAGEWTYLHQTLTAPASTARFVTRARHAGTPSASDIYYVWALRAIQPGGFARELVGCVDVGADLVHGVGCGLRPVHQRIARHRDACLSAFDDPVPVRPVRGRRLRAQGADHGRSGRDGCGFPACAADEVRRYVDVLPCPDRVRSQRCDGSESDPGHHSGRLVGDFAVHVLRERPVLDQGQAHR
jgi:hypothetical protein